VFPARFPGKAVAFAVRFARYPRAALLSLFPARGGTDGGARVTALLEEPAGDASRPSRAMAGLPSLHALVAPRVVFACAGDGGKHAEVPAKLVAQVPRTSLSVSPARQPPPPRTKWTRRVPHPVLIGHAASLPPRAGM